jgi:hypothetical protein
MKNLYVDTTDFDIRFKQICENAIPGLVEKGLFEAMNKLLSDAVKLPPQAPKDVGALWASKADTVSVKKEEGQIVAQGGFNIEYAARWHEAVGENINWTTTKGATHPGPKYLESKMTQKKDKYMGIVAESIKNQAK